MPFEYNDNLINLAKRTRRAVVGGRGTVDMHHNGVDVCITHQKFISKGTPGAFRLAKGGHELPFYMENSLASLAFRYPSEEELVLIFTTLRS